MAEIEYLDDQRFIIQNTKSFGEYRKFHNQHFSGGTWLKMMGDDLNELDRNGIQVSKKYFQFVTAMHFLAAQACLPRLDDISDRYRKYNPHIMVSAPSWQLAVGCHCAHLNVLSIEKKKEILNEIPSLEEFELWGIFLKPYGKDWNEKAAKTRMRARFDSPYSICEPDLGLSLQLEELNFSYEKAKAQRQNNFREEVVLRLKNIFLGVFDPEEVFACPQLNNRWR